MMTNELPTYKETVKRYRVLRHEEMSNERKAHYRLNGIDPDDNWSLIWSFDRLESAEKQLRHYNEDPDKPTYYTYKIVDGGKTEVFERTAWF